MNEIFILTFSCQDRPGLVAAVAGLLFQQGGNILDAQQFTDQETKRFLCALFLKWKIQSDFRMSLKFWQKRMV
jgi:formyltetrahydrofolate hydrolase